MLMVTSICKKTTQAINYFARKKEGQINKMKAIKLIYLADRYHLRKYGRPVIGDAYWAMKLGPVGSYTLNVANLSEENLDRECLRYAREYLGHPKNDSKNQEMLSKKEVDMETFSQTDIEAFERIYQEFGDKDQFELARVITHGYPEWSKFRKDIESGKTRRARMDYMDFFKNPTESGSSVFDVDEEHLNLSKEAFLENQKVAELLK
ncbi:MAG TPA: Panacea domain-containing protein [Candidatus Paceibacterota bacterium]